MPRAVPTIEPSEADFQKTVIDLLHRHQWRLVHFKPSMTSTGFWATHGSGEVKGWPDLFAVRGRRALTLEVKSNKGRVSVAQQDWLDALGHAGIEAHVVRPKDWDQLVELVK